MDQTWLEELKSELLYEPLTGHFFWLKSKTGRRNKNPHAGCKTKHGYVVICFKGKVVPAHRLAWNLAHGPIPEKMEIDHINGNPSDNSLVNLRVATSGQNSFNRRAPRTNKSGIKGVCWLPKRKKWLAQLFLNYKNHKLGYFDSKFEAHEAVKTARIKLHGEFTRHD